MSKSSPTDPPSILYGNTGHTANSGQQDSPAFSMGSSANVPNNNNAQSILTSPLDQYRLSQLYQYAMVERLRCPPGAYLPPGIRPELAPLFYGPYCRLDPRLAGLCRSPEEPKPQYSYIGLIAMAILSSPDMKLVLSDIYQCEFFRFFLEGLV